MSQWMKKLKPKQFLLLRRVGKAAEESGRSIYLVGGAVRDLMLNRPTADLDLVLEGSAPAFARILKKKLGGQLTVHAQFGTATLDLPDGQRLDFVTARQEKYMRPGALPTVAKGSLREDAFRRDFTINAMAISLKPRSFGEVLDYYGGQADLQAGRVRVLHPASFRDDPTRIFRAVRYEQRYGFRMVRSTLALLKQAVEDRVFDTISMQRYINEIDKIFSEKAPLPAMQRLVALDVLDHLHPDMRVGRTVFEGFERAIGRRIFPGRWEQVSVPTVYWMGLLDRCSAAARQAVITQAPFTKARRTALQRIEELKKLATRLKKARRRPSVVYGWLTKYSEEELLFLWVKSRTFGGRTNIQTFLEKRETEMWITGNDLRELGLRSGRRVGEILARVFDAKLDRGLPTKAEELAVARDFIQETQ